MGRTWAGWDDRATLAEIWDANRGQWVINEDRLAGERYATMSYEGIVRLVAEISGSHSVPGGYRVVEGQLLPASHPVSMSLIGMPLVGHRNPVSYFDTSDLERTNRAGVPYRTFLLTYNPARFDFYGTDVREVQAQLAAGVDAPGQWSVGRNKRGIGPGDHFYLIMQGAGQRGIIASGVIVSEIYQDEHFDPAATQQANYADVSWTALVDEDALLPLDQLKAAFPEQHWTPYGSGKKVDPSIVDDLATMWAHHVGAAAAKGHAPTPPSGACR